MENDELVKALRNCACIRTDGSCANCGYRKSTECKWMMVRDAADAIERLMGEIDRKDKALQAWVKTWESRKENALRHICDHCDTPIDVRLRENACEDCPIKILIKEIFDEQP